VNCLISSADPVFDVLSFVFIMWTFSILMLYNLNEENDGESEEQVVVGSYSGILNRLRVRDVSIQSRTAK
jgi:hypothetical protein